jgi:hypothetical protein
VEFLDIGNSANINSSSNMNKSQQRQIKPAAGPRVNSNLQNLEDQLARTGKPV